MKVSEVSLRVVPGLLFLQCLLLSVALFQDHPAHGISESTHHALCAVVSSEDCSYLIQIGDLAADLLLLFFSRTNFSVAEPEQADIVFLASAVINMVFSCLDPSFPRPPPVS